MLKLVHSIWLVVVFVCLLPLLAGVASAGYFSSTESVLKFNLGVLPPIKMVANGGGGVNPGEDGPYAVVVNNGSQHDLFWSAGRPTAVWNTTGRMLPASQIPDNVTGITGLTLTAALVQSGSFTASFSAPNPVGGSESLTPSLGTICPDGCLGGQGSMLGALRVGVNGDSLTWPLTGVVGVGGATVDSILGNAIWLTGAPWFTGPVRVTNITTNFISLPDRGVGVTGLGITLEPNGNEAVRTFTQGGGFLSTNPNGLIETMTSVVLWGTSSLPSAAQSGHLTLISPVRIQVPAVLGYGNSVGKFEAKLVFHAPEPSSTLLLLSGVAGLIFIGRKRMKR